MRLLVPGACVVVAGLLSAGASAEADTVWSKARSPAAGPALSIGSYSSGCVQGARELPMPAQGGRYTVMRPERRRVFGHPLLIDFIVQLGARLEQRQLGPLGVGDLGQARGGPAPNGHASHQTGLDVDLWYEAGTPGAEQHSVVDREGQKPSAYWSERIPALLELAASAPHVARIFVNAVVKQQLCQASAAPGTGLTAKDRNKGVATYQKRVGAQPRLPDSCKKVAASRPANGKGATAAPEPP